MSTIKTKNIQQTVISGTTQPLKIGGIAADGSDAKINITTDGKVSIGSSNGYSNLTITQTGQNDTYGIVQTYNDYIGNSGYTAKNYYGTSQFMQWENKGLRLGSRITTNSGAGDVYITTGNDSVKMTIDSAGRVSIPNQIGFCTYWPSTTTFANGATLTGGSTNFNYGSAYNTATGIFTAPIAGRYLVNWVMRVTNRATNAIGVVHKNGVAMNGNLYLEAIATSAIEHFGGSTIYYLNANDYLTFKNGSGSINMDQNDSISVHYLG